MFSYDYPRISPLSRKNKFSSGMAINMSCVERVLLTA
jgi:hypothetical protein